jgi:glycosyltransferase involved in cell wall biosynthesis
MASRPSLAIIVPAYCEAQNIIATLENVTRALAPLALTSEIIVIDDGSPDGTGDVVTANLSRFPGVRLLTNERNLGFGASYRRGVDAAALDHIVMVHGDNAWGHETLREFFSHVGESDIIVGYTREMWRSRTWRRAFISKTYTWLVNLVTGYRLTYYNGLQIHRAATLKHLQIESSGYGFQAEVLVKALRASAGCIEVPMDLIERVHGDSHAFRLKNVVDVARTLRRLALLPKVSPSPAGVAGATSR